MSALSDIEHLPPNNKELVILGNSKILNPIPRSKVNKLYPLGLARTLLEKYTKNGSSSPVCTSAPKPKEVAIVSTESPTPAVNPCF